MNKKIINVIFFIALLMTSHKAMSYVVTVYNETERSIRLDAKLAATNEIRNVAVEPHKIGEINSAGWCIDWIMGTLIAYGDKVAYTTRAIQGPSTGFGISCRNFEVHVKPTAKNNEIILDAR